MVAERWAAFEHFNGARQVIAIFWFKEKRVFIV